MTTDSGDTNKTTSTPTPEGEKKKRTFWQKFYDFIAMGGFLLILIVIAALVIGISIGVSNCGK